MTHHSDTFLGKTSWIYIPWCTHLSTHPLYTLPIAQTCLTLTTQNPLSLPANFCGKAVATVTRWVPEKHGVTVEGGSPTNAKDVSKKLRRQNSSSQNPSQGLLRFVRKQSSRDQPHPWLQVHHLAPDSLSEYLADCNVMWCLECLEWRKYRLQISKNGAPCGPLKKLQTSNWSSLGGWNQPAS